MKRMHHKRAPFCSHNGIKANGFPNGQQPRHGSRHSRWKHERTDIRDSMPGLGLATHALRATLSSRGRSPLDDTNPFPSWSWSWSGRGGKWLRKEPDLLRVIGIGKSTYWFPGGISQSRVISPMLPCCCVIAFWWQTLFNENSTRCLCVA